MRDLSALTYLGIEDDANARQILRILLERVIGSSDIVLLEDSHKFPERINSLPFVPDVVFLDIGVKPYDGYEMLQMLKQMPSFQQSKLIALTAKVMREEIRRMKEAGFHGLISKPVDRHIFPILMQKIMANESVWYIA